MSVAMASQSQAPELDKHKSKSSKRHRSEHGEKKRKRENSDEQTKKSKKHKSELSIQASQEAITANVHQEARDRRSVSPIAQLSSRKESPIMRRTSKSKSPKFEKTEILDSEEERERQRLKSKQKVAKEHISDVEEIPKPKKKSKSKKNKDTLVELMDIEMADVTPRAKKHRDLPDRSKTSSPVPRIGSKKSKSKKQKSLQLVQPAEEDNSPFHTQTSSLYLPLAPVSQKYPLEGLCAEHISPLILTYYPPLRGVILAYSNPRYGEEPFENDGHSTLLHNINEYAVSWTWVTADFLLFKPEKGVWLEGYINLQNEGHLGVVCWNLFNASIERKRLPEDWKWIGIEDEGGEDVDGMGETYAENGVGYWVDGDGTKINGQIKFRVREIETSHDRERGFLSIEGTMLDDEAENVLLQEEVEQKTSKETAGRRLGGLKARGATSLGVPVEEGLLDGVEKTQKRKKF